MIPLLILSLPALPPPSGPEPLPPIEKVEIGRHRELRVNGRPFFPLMSWLQSPSRFPALRELGFNTFCGGRARDLCEAAEKAGGYAMPSFEADFRGHRAVLAWIQGDEPDLGFHEGKPRRSPQEIRDEYARLRAADGSRPVFLNFTAHFMDGPEWAAKRSSEEKKAYYGAAAGGGDILCFDVYPIYGRNAEDKLIWVADGVRQLREYAGPHRPVFAWIETGKGSRWISYDRQKDVRPEHTRAEVWMAILRGATGIGYFTHAWRPRFTEFSPGVPMQKELQRLNRQITTLAPVILSAPPPTRVSMVLSGGLPGEVMVREQEGALYLFANNLDMTGKVGKATFTVEGLRKGTPVEVLDENRRIVAGEGTFSDEFGPLEVHLYRIPR